jgi:hypothetical protein
MRLVARALVVLGFVTLTLPTAAHAEAFGPLCWIWNVEGEATFSLVFFVDPSHPDLATVVGKILPAPALGPSTPVSGSAHRSDSADGPVVRMILSSGWMATLGRPLTLSIVFRLSDLTGFGSCFQSQGQDPCGSGKALTWTPGSRTAGCF